LKTLITGFQKFVWFFGIVKYATHFLKLHIVEESGQ